MIADLGSSKEDAPAVMAGASVLSVDTHLASVAVSASCCTWRGGEGWAGYQPAHP